jgi:hypothetical protein
MSDSGETNPKAGDVLQMLGWMDCVFWLHVWLGIKAAAEVHQARTWY